MLNVSNKNLKYVDWLEKSIANEYLNYYEYSEFENIRQISNGAFGSIFRANWKKTDTVLVLKFFINQKSTLKEIVNEVWKFNNFFRKLYFI